MADEVLTKKLEGTFSKVIICVSGFGPLTVKILIGSVDGFISKEESQLLCDLEIKGCYVFGVEVLCNCVTERKLISIVVTEVGNVFFRGSKISKKHWFIFEKLREVVRNISISWDFGNFDGILVEKPIVSFFRKGI